LIIQVNKEVIMPLKLHYYHTLFISVLVPVFLNGCAVNQTGFNHSPNGSPQNHLAHAAHLIKKGHTQQAREYLIPELRKNPKNCAFNLLNALSYHIEARNNNYGKLKLAHVGYVVAKHSCHGNPWPYYYDAIIDFDQGDYKQAAHDFAIASQLSQHPDEKEIFTEGLILSSYAANELPAYENTIRLLIKHSHKNKFIYNRLKSQSARLSQRAPVARSNDASESGDASAETHQAKQVIVDAIIILNRHTSFKRSGINLLNALQLQFSYNNTYSSSDDLLLNNRIVTHSISIPEITYDLNIFNSAHEHSEILARPTLLAENGKEAKYFSGDKLILGIAGGETSSIETFLIGVNMKITPEFLDDGSINLTVKVGRDFILPATANRAVQFENVVDTISEDVETTVNVHYGETVILSALSEKERAGNVDRTPVISRIPLLNYLFRDERERLNETSVLILLTPQRYIGFPNTSVIDTHNYTAFMNNALFDPSTNIDNVLKDLGDLSLYKAKKEEGFYGVLQFNEMTQKMLEEPLFRESVTRYKRR